MKVVTSHPALMQGSAEACPPRSGTAAQGLTGIARRAFTLIHRYRTNVMLVCLAIAVFAMPHLAGATDLLAAQKQDAKDTFGHGSTVEWGFYIGEIIISIGGYIKTRNPMLFVGGLAFLIVITRTFFALAG
jgi:type IV conjugative transfer system pilin TraA